MHAKNHGSPWTNIDIDWVVMATKSGETNAAIAGVMGRTISSVSSLKQREDVRSRLKSGKVAVKKAELPLKPSWPWPVSHSERETAKPKAARKKGKLWTTDDVITIAKMFKRGDTPPFMAAEVDRTVAGVLGKLKNLGLLEFDRDVMAYFIPRKLYMQV